MKEKIINGQRCRLYREDYVWIWVSETGELVKRYKKGGYVGGNIKILKDHRGPFVKDAFGNVVCVAKAVITCFCPPCPSDGKIYIINRKDGNWMNCHYRNLEWVPYHYRHTTVPKVRLYIKGRFIEVYSSGKIVVDRAELTHCDYLYDPDVDFHAIIKPHVRIDRTRYDIDDLMKMAGYVNGDDANLKNPVILHRDNNEMNFSSDNLEWVEKTDPRYSAYESEMIESRKTRSKEMNGNKQLPPGWNY